MALTHCSVHGTGRSNLASAAARILNLVLRRSARASAPGGNAPRTPLSHAAFSTFVRI